MLQTRFGRSGQTPEARAGWQARFGYYCQKQVQRGAIVAKLREREKLQWSCPVFVDSSPLGQGRTAQVIVFADSQGDSQAGGHAWTLANNCGLAMFATEREGTLADVHGWPARGEGGQ